MAEHHAYLGLMLDLAAHRRRARSTSCTTTASTTCRSRWLRRCRRADGDHPAHAADPVAGVGGAALAAGAGSFAAVSAVHGTRLARTPSTSDVDPQRRRHRVAGGRARRRPGRLVGPARPREGARTSRSTPPALAGVPLVLAGPVRTRTYFEREVAPRLGDDVRVRRAPRPARPVRLVGGGGGRGGDAQLGRALRPGRRRGDGLRHPGRRLRPRCASARSWTTAPGACSPRPATSRRWPRRSRRAARARPRRRARHAVATLSRRRDGRRATSGSTPSSAPGDSATARVTGVIGYYVHHHRQRAPAPGPLAAGRSRRRGVTGLSSLPRPGRLATGTGCGCRATTTADARGRHRATATCTGLPSHDPGLLHRMAARLGRGSRSRPSRRCWSSTSRSR